MNELYVRHVLFKIKKFYGTMWDVLSYDVPFKDYIVVPLISWIKLCSRPKLKNNLNYFMKKTTIICMDINNLIPSLNYLTYKSIYEGR
jgi:hypothetical protein